MTALPTPTWIVGCGNMGRAIVDGWKLAGLDFSNTVVIRPSGAAVEGIRTVASLAEAGAAPKLVLLAVKPQKLDEVAAQLKPWLTSRCTLVSILAGVEAATLRKRFPTAGPVARAMPNLPVAVRRGVVALYGEDVPEAAKTQVSDLFAALGWAMWMADEAKFDAVGSIAGAGPAYAARFIAALAKAGEQRGLSAETAATVALETVLGTGWLAASTRESMDALARRVASPNGTTEAGLAILDRDGVLDQLVSVTMDAAARREAELANEAKGRSLAGEPQLS